MHQTLGSISRERKKKERKRKEERKEGRVHKNDY
jgi:hypothetical protein